MGVPAEREYIMISAANKITKDLNRGDSFQDILRLWFPEVITQLIFITLTPLIDAYFIASLKSTAMYGALAVANTFFHFIIKFTEAGPAAAIVVIGRHNGAKEYKKCGQGLYDMIVFTFVLGLIQFFILFFLAEPIYRFLGAPEELVPYGVPFIRMRAFGFFLVFVAGSFIGFMKGIKNTKVPMIISAIGVLCYVIFDYLLILGKFGFPSLGLRGSALATIIQYFFVIISYIVFIFSNAEYRKYFPSIKEISFSIKRIITLFNLSWPVFLDKGSLAFTFIWFVKMISPMGIIAISSFETIKNLERLMLMPAVAFSQVVGFLVSNRLGAKDVLGAKINIKKNYILATFFAVIMLSIWAFNAKYFVSFFDTNNLFSNLACQLIVFVAIMDLFDYTQVVFANSLRGAGDVRKVMMYRVLCCLGYFAPTVYIVSKLPIADMFTKFLMMYFVFYSNCALLGFSFFRRIISGKWQSAVKV